MADALIYRISPAPSLSIVVVCSNWKYKSKTCDVLCATEKLCMYMGTC